MFTPKQLSNYADVLLWGLKKARKKKFKHGEIIMVHYDAAAGALAEQLQARILSAGINPVMRSSGTFVMESNLFHRGNDRQLVFQAPGTKELFESLHGSIYLYAPESLTHLKDVDPKRIAIAAVSRKPLRDILFRREETGWFGWTLCMVPTPALAKHAKISASEYAREIIKACFLQKNDPVGEWESVYRDALSIKKWLNSLKVKSYSVEAETFSLRITPGERRKWIGISGHNIPSFELFLSPDWRGTEGSYYADQPSYRSGNYVQGVRLGFRKGSAVTVKAETGDKFVKSQLSMDGGANKIGEFSLTDKRFSKINRFMANTLFDENYGGRYGNCHIALGSSYSDTYDGDVGALTAAVKKKLGFNDSALHWDLVNTERKTVSADLVSGKRVVIYEDGKFRY
ncbi:MAG: aminopeptidase [Deltaproteobacteria bacterium]|nr:aminopeptidase [Deltaproteobacteria bacterium]